MRKKFVYSIWIFLIIISCFNLIEASEQIYYPHPIIFVHGLDGKISDWNYTKDQLEKYFKDGAVFKYPLQDTKYDYFPLCDYQRKNKGDIPNIATTFLEGSIELALKSIPREVPESEQKVIIVAHSMGGLVVRSLLKQDLSGYYASKIDKVVFIGTPHLGSPCADSVWLLNKIRQDIINPAVSDYSTFYSQNVGTRFNFSDTSSSLAITGLPSEINNYLLNMLGGEQARINNALRYADEHGLSGSTAVEQLRLNQNVNFHKTIVAAIGVQKSNVELNGSTVGSETFIGKASENLANPENFKIILGVNPYPDWAKIRDVFVTRIYTLYNNDFTFPTNLSMDDAVSTGDVIVPQASQGGIGGGADYFVNAVHTEEPKQYKAILQAIDDKPVIEDVRIVSSFVKVLAPPYNKFYPHETYIIVKVKDYLLADIEFKTTGISADLNDFLDPNSPTPVYKPYVKFKKDFLREREKGLTLKDINGNEFYLKLEPGEFYFRVSGLYNASIKIKNPAQQEAECQIYTKQYLSQPFVIFREGRGAEDLVLDRSGDGRYDPHWDDHGGTPARTFEALNGWAYNSLKSCPYLFYTGSGGTRNFGGDLGAGLHAHASWSSGPGSPPSNAARVVTYSMEYSNFINLYVEPSNTSGKKIRATKITGHIYKGTATEVNGFTMLVSRDSTNTWPPTPYSEGDKDLFSVNTSGYKNCGYFESQIDPNQINPSGNNVWKSMSDIVEDCHVLNPPQHDLDTNHSYRENVYYERSAYIRYPYLVLIFE